MINLKLVNLLSDLCVYAPDSKAMMEAKKVNKNSVFASLRNRTNKRTSELITVDHVENLKREAGLSKNRESAPKVMSTIGIESKMSSTISPL